MGGRPKVRTERVKPMVLEVMRDVFGSATNGFENLKLHQVTYDNFLRAWKGQEVTKRDRLVIEQGWGQFLRKIRELPEEHLKDIELAEDEPPAPFQVDPKAA